jgi:hypothetical protein
MKTEPNNKTLLAFVDETGDRGYDSLRSSSVRNLIIYAAYAACA